MRPALKWLALGCAVLASGCVHPPKPWEKGQLAKPAMVLGRDPLGDRFDEHIAASKSAASGGYGIGGGGCGCN